MILLCAEGLPHQEIALRLGVRPNTVWKWIKRWIQRSTEPVAERLSDSSRSGAPAKFCPEQICRIIALACEDPCDHERPITHWTVRELRDQAVQEQIVSEISERQVRRILHEADLQPHRVRYWLNAKIDPEKEQKIQSICEVYQQAAAAAAQGEVTFSVDENTGIQALQRIAPDRPMKPGRVQEIEFEYKHHGQTHEVDLHRQTGTSSLTVLRRSITLASPGYIDMIAPSATTIVVPIKKGG